MTHPQGLAATSLETPNNESVAGLALINVDLLNTGSNPAGCHE